MYEVENSSSYPVASIHVYLGTSRLVSKLSILDNPDFLTESGNTFYYHADHLGSSSLITDNKGREYERMAFTPHGEVWQHDTLDTLERIDLLFTGKAMDAETGWYYFGARYLDPRTGMWLSGDPALGEYIPQAPLTQEAKDANGNLPGMGGVYNPVNLALYHYAGNNPIKYTDPDGEIGVLGVAGIVVGAAATWLALSFGYDKETGTWHSQPWCMQRLFGYHDVYDKMAKGIGFQIDSKAIAFQVGDEKITIRAWKGHYWGAAGGEVGIYGGKNGTSAWGHKIKVQFTLIGSDGKTEILDSPEKNQFWLFSSKAGAGKGDYAKGSYTLTGTIDFNEDTATADAFEAASKDNPNFKVNRLDGNLFEFTWTGE